MDEQAIDSPTYPSLLPSARHHRSLIVEYSESPISALTVDSSMAPGNKKKGSAATARGAASGPSTPVRRGGKSPPTKRTPPRECKTAGATRKQQKKATAKKACLESTADADTTKLDGFRFDLEGQDGDEEASDQYDTFGGDGKDRAGGLTRKRKKTDDDPSSAGDGSDSSEDTDSSEQSHEPNTIVEVPEQQEGNDDEEEAGSDGDEGGTLQGIAEGNEEDDEVDDDDDDVAPDNLARIANEKEFVEVIKTPKNLKSLLWSKVRFLDVPKILDKCKVDTEKKYNFEGIKKLREESKKANTALVVCSLCFDEPNVSLSNSVLQLSTKVNKKGDKNANVSNVASHVERKAKQGEPVHAQLWKDFKEKKSSTSQQDDTMSIMSVGTAGTVGTGTRSVGTHPYSEWVGMSRAQIINKLHELIYVFVNDANIAAHVVRNPKLWNVIEFAVTNGRQLVGIDKDALQMGRHKFNSMQAISFGTMVHTVERLVEDTREYFRRVTKKTVPFIYIGHDIWDGKNKSILGLCLFLASPLLKELLVIPVAMLRNRGKDAQAIADQSHKALQR